jgi:hypothetical protein
MTGAAVQPRAGLARPVCWRQVGLALAVAGAAFRACAAPMLDDGPEGLTCQYYVAMAELAWERPGGDWRDANGAAHGDRPFSTAPSGTGRRLRRLQWDVTAIARAWQPASPTAGAVMLRGPAGEGAAIVNLRSREHADEAGRPELVVTWADGRQDRIEARADTYFSCPSRRSAGGAAHLKVGGGHAALLAFSWPAGTDPARVRSARLELTADQTYGRGLDVGTFRPVVPADDAAPPRRGLAAAYARDAGIEAHPDVLLVDRFEPGRGKGAWTGAAMDDKHTVVEDAAEGFRPLDGRALKVVIPEGRNEGLNSHHRFARGPAGEPEEAFVRYYLRLGSSWNPVRDGGKLPGFAGTYGRGGWGMRPSDGVNGWSARGAFFRQAPAGPNAELRGIGSYVYHADGEGRSGATWGWSLGAGGLLQKHRWYSVEQQLRLNRPGQSDGELRAWIDGVLVFERKHLRFRDTDDLRIESLWLNVYHGGTAKAVADMALYIDNLVIARRYIGPATGLP